MNWTKAIGEDPGLLSHAWSLSIEEQFYIAWPIVLLGCLVLSRGRLLPIAASVMAMTVVIALWRGMNWSPDAFDRVYWATDTRADALLIGCAAAIFISTRPITAPLVVAVCAAIAVAAVMFLSNVATLAVFGLAVVAIASVVLIVAVMHEGPVERVLSWQPLVYIGTISYGLYLFHRPIMRLGTSLGVEGQIVPVLVMVLLSFAAAVLSWRFVEQPFLRLKAKRWAARRRRRDGAGAIADAAGPDEHLTTGSTVDRSTASS
jgi:peptidoglycan/LPS O-acetylase OafA/YrhL